MTKTTVVVIGLAAALLAAWLLPAKPPAAAAWPPPDWAARQARIEAIQKRGDERLAESMEYLAEVEAWMKAYPYLPPPRQRLPPPPAR
jgi:hypothetical protein